MTFVHKLVESGRRLYHGKDAKLHGVWPLLDAAETFLLTPDTRTGRQGPHVRDYLDLKRTMWTVIVALLPCLLWSIWNVGAQHFQALDGLVASGKGSPYPAQLGWLQGLLFGSAYAPNLAAPGFGDVVVFGLQQMLPILVVSYGVGLGIEGLFAVIRKEEVSEGYLVSGMLIALIVPASIPLWQLALGVIFAVVLAKEVFGGTGMNIFNPAMMCRAFLFFAFPAQMSGDFVWVAGNNSGHLLDGYSRPTPLAVVKPTTLADGADALVQAQYSIGDLFLGAIPGSTGETSKLCVLVGALLLIVTGVGSWRVMVGGVLGLLGSAFVLQALLGDAAGGALSLPPHLHLLVGGFAFGLVFMATDPVSSPETNTGKWIYGAMIGFVTILVRAINPAYPEGTMLSILLLNAFAPGIDHFVVAANIRRRKVRLGH